jgi:hypothetical protein
VVVVVVVVVVAAAAEVIEFNTYSECLKIMLTPHQTENSSPQSTRNVCCCYYHHHNGDSFVLKHHTIKMKREVNVRNYSSPL